MESPGIVIPARDASADIDATLRALSTQEHHGPLTIVVAVNDCRDNTAEVARSWTDRFRNRGWDCSVIDTPPGKAAAMNAAELLLPRGMRIYVDHDAVLAPNTLRRLTHALRPGSGTHFASPRAVVAASPSQLVRAYYSTWQRLPYVRDSPVTIGVYAVSASGRRRWHRFPAVHSDDKFVRLHFEPHERRCLADVTYTVNCPSSIGEMVRYRRRYTQGNKELSTLFPALPEHDVHRYRGATKALLSRPSLWPAAATFLGVHLAASLF